MGDKPTNEQRIEVCEQLIHLQGTIINELRERIEDLEARVSDTEAAIAARSAK